MSNKADKVTEGTKIAAKAREKCNRLSDKARQSLSAAAMRMIYHNQADTGSALAHRR